ncbi:protein BCCIP homolog [Bacillus rossius redtenbacheri]|uniref:protein BCCIP homolog n=1 Tax=Bacillus rossius redtenbacheri TaxID=93214 RepID=UPI002FDCBA3A
MSAPMKKRAVAEKNHSVESNSESDSDDNSSAENREEYVGNEEIQVDFEGRNPVDSDFHGIKQLLKQLFLKAHVNLSELTDLIIAQNYVGSVVKQSDLEEEGSDDEDEDDSGVNDVFGITTVVNLTDKQNTESVQQLRALLAELSGEHATDQVNSLVRSLLGDDSRPVGLLLNERFVNIPAQIAVPLLESLSKEISRACQKKMPFDLSYLILICKLYKVEGGSQGRRNRNRNKKQQDTSEQEVVWLNPEEALFDEVADCKFEFCVKGESDTGLGGQWQEDDVAMTPYRRVLLFQADKLESAITRIKAFLGQ